MRPQPRKKVIKKPKIKTSTIEIRGYIHDMEEALKGTKHEGRKLLGLPIKIGGETMGWICRVDDQAGFWYAKIDVSSEMKEDLTKNRMTSMEIIKEKKNEG